MMILETKSNQAERTATNTELAMHEGTITLYGNQKEIEFFIDRVIELFNGVCAGWMGKEER